MSARIVIWGAGGHAKVVADILRLQSEFEIAGFIDDSNPSRQGEPFCGAFILGRLDALDRLHGQGVRHAILAFGNCAKRLELTCWLETKGFELATAIHPRAIIAKDTTLGSGAMIVAGAIINPGAKIGRSVIINTAATIDHDCTILDAAHICPGVHLAGNVQVGAAAWVGIGASVVQNVKIGDRALVGAGAVVVSDIPPDAVAYGVPAKVHRIQPHEKP